MRYRYSFIVLAFAVLLISVSANYSSKYFEISKQIEIFANLYKEVNTYYVDDLDPAKLMRTGVDAMLESLDPYTNYISESEIEGYRYVTEGKYNGIGASVKKMDDYITITEVHVNSPADKAGLKIGDKVLAVDGQSAKGKDRYELDEILKGFPGTEVTLQIERPGQQQPLNIDLMRDVVEVKNVPYSGLISDDIGYVSLTTFTRNAGRNIGRVIDTLKAQQPDLKGLILDLRDNGGGLLNEAVNLCNLFIPKGELIVTTKGKVIDWDRSFNTLNAPKDLDIPLTVLVNERSASASEIVAGVIQDYDRGVLIGQQTYGKGLVQNTREVGYNSQVKLTTAKYYIPSGRCIQAVEYKDGEPADIPDDKRTPFETRNGRTVLDGGGLKPDLVQEKFTNTSIIQALRKENLIFHYATKYKLDHPETPSLEHFEFTNFEDFVSFVKTSGFVFESQSSKALSELMSRAEKEKYKGSIASEVSALKTSIEAVQADDLAKYRKEIISLIEKEIIGRHFGYSGRIEFGLNNDTEIQTAIDIMRNDSEYQAVLNK